MHLSVGVPSFIYTSAGPARLFFIHAIFHSYNNCFNFLLKHEIELKNIKYLQFLALWVLYKKKNNRTQRARGGNFRIKVIEKKFWKKQLFVQRFLYGLNKAI